MLNTIRECNAAITEVNHKIARLELERSNIIAVRDHLEKVRKDPKPVLPPPKYTTRGRIYTIIKDHPGIDGRTVRSELVEDLPMRKITTFMTGLRRAGHIENRGTQGIGARWYVKEN
jgi:hypothetical protein